MRKLRRQNLSSRALRFLERRISKIAYITTHAGQVREAKRLWKFKNNKAFKEIRTKLRQMAPGIDRCMYCEDSAGTDIEHFWPKNTYPLKAFDWDNYLLACSTCNSNYKRSEFPLDTEERPLLIDPVKEDPRQHIALSPSTGLYTNLTLKGSESIRVYCLNRSILVQGRHDAFVSVQVHIIHYGNQCLNGNMDEAQRIQSAICRFPHAGVFIAVLDIVDNPVSNLFLMQECIQTVHQYPEIRDWLP